MNLDERIDTALRNVAEKDGDSYYGIAFSEGQAESFHPDAVGENGYGGESVNLMHHEIKQLIREVLDHVKPYPTSEPNDHFGKTYETGLNKGYNAAIHDMEAIRKELGL